MSGFAATGWVFAVTFTLVSLVAVAEALRSSARFDVVTGTFAQLIAYWLGMFAILRIYAADVSVRRFIGLRPTAAAIYPLALGLGAALSLPTSKIGEVIMERWPIALEVTMSERWEAATPARRVVMGAMLAVLGPIVEETLFRGALFVPLKRFALGARMSAPEDDDESAPRRPLAVASSAPSDPRAAGWRVVAVTAALFVGVHLVWQVFLPLAVVAVALGWLRWRSGSIIPPILVHVGYNATAVVEMAFLSEVETIPIPWAVGSAGLAAALLIAIWKLCQGEAAESARAEEL